MNNKQMNYYTCSKCRKRLSSDDYLIHDPYCIDIQKTSLLKRTHNRLKNLPSRIINFLESAQIRSLSTKQESVKSRSLFTDAIFIALATGIAYYCAYYYEVGLCEYYSIDRRFISLNLNNLIEVYGRTIGEFSKPITLFITILALVLYSFLNYSKNKNFISSHNYVFHNVIIIAFLIYWIFFDNSINKYTYILWYIITIIIFEIIYFLKNFYPPFFIRILGTIVLIGVGLVILSYETGKNYAENKIYYSIIMLPTEQKEYKEYVVLRIYGEHLFTAPLFRNKSYRNEFEKEIVILNVSNINANSPLKFETVGPLQPYFDYSPY